MEIKREVTINGCRDCPDLADVEVGQIEAGLELEVLGGPSPGPAGELQRRVVM
jgi:hypothetical protein